MKVTADNMDSVHALRQPFQYGSRHEFRYAFDPSDHLRSAFERYTHTEPGAARSRFLFYATRLIALDTLHYPKDDINAEYQFANRAFMRLHSKQFEVGKAGGQNGQVRVGMTRLENDSLKVSLLPKDALAFNNSLVGLASIGEDEIPDPIKEESRHYLYTIIPASVLKHDAITEASQALTSELARTDRASVYTVSPSSIDRRVIPIVAEPPQENPPN